MTNLWLHASRWDYDFPWDCSMRSLPSSSAANVCFAVGLGALSLGIVFHLVALVEDGLAMPSFSDHYSGGGRPLVRASRRLRLFCCTFIGDTRFHSFSVFVFPLVFVLTLVAAVERSENPWGPPLLRTTWLYLHVILHHPWIHGVLRASLPPQTACT